MKKFIFLASVIFFTTFLSMAQTVDQDGLITTSGAHSVDETVGLLKTAIEEMGLTLVAEIDHAQAAGRNNLELRPTFVLLFGNPQVGTNLMQADQRAGLDLPLRMLIRENEEEKVLVSYYDPMKLQEKYQLGGEKETLEKMQGVLKKLSQRVSKEK
jgi:uncharacterized protein (DUF302 family)